MIVQGGAGHEDRLYDVCIVGAGPAGLAAAFACSERGQTVALLEAGGLKPGPATALTLNNITPHAHESLHLTLRGGLGGTSSAWGGTCVPYDAADFAPQWWDRSVGWPIPYPDMAAWYHEAAGFLGVAAPGEPDLASEADAGPLDLTQCHRIGAQPNIGRRYEDALRRSATIDVFLATTLAGLRCGADGARVGAAETEGPRGRGRVRAGRFILAGGGLATTQMLLGLAADWPRHFAGGRAPLGRYYMGHLTGLIATLVFRRPDDAAAFLYAGDGRNVWRQRRIKLRAGTRADNALLNTAFVLRAPHLADHRHRSGAWSAVHLIKPLVAPLRRLASGTPVAARAASGPRPGGWNHLRNVVGDPLGTARGIGTLAAQSRIPNMPRLLMNPGGRYALDYHAEQMAAVGSRVYRDPACPQDLTVDFGFLPQDVESVVRSHAILDDALRAAEIGHLEYSVDPADREASVRQQALDGYHQIGTTRMSSSSDLGVVDRDCRVFGFENLYVASSSVFPTSGSANPTLTTVALARRLGHHLSANPAR